MSAYKHLTFQFVLLELVTHLIYAPLPSTHQPRPMGEYSRQVCCLLDGMLLLLLNLSKRNRNMISILLQLNCC